MDLFKFKEELHVLCKEWLENQISDLEEDDLPPEEEIEADILDMREDTFASLAPFIDSTNAITEGVPNDNGNTKALHILVKQYSGHEKTTPIFTSLALSKVDQGRYQKGWPLCVIRVIAEASLKRSISN